MAAWTEASGLRKWPSVESSFPFVRTGHSPRDLNAARHARGIRTMLWSMESAESQKPKSISGTSVDRAVGNLALINADGFNHAGI